MINFKNGFQHLGKYLARPISMNRLVQYTGQPLFLPFYHVVGEAHDLPHIRHLYPIRNTKTFEADLDFFLKHFEPVALEELLTISDSKSKFHLTFDDGLSELHHLIAPILKRKGIPATFFLNTDFIDNRGLFFRYKASLIIDFCLKNDIGKINNYSPLDLLRIKYSNQDTLDNIAQEIGFDFQDFLQKRQPYLSSEQIKNLQEDGFHFGGHSLNHPLFSELNLSNQLHQAGTSVQYVKETFNESVSAFAFPFTDYGVPEDFFEKAASSQLFDISFGTAGLKINAHKIDTQKAHFQRFPMEGNNWNADDLVKTEYLYFLLKRMIGKHKYPARIVK